MKKDLTTRHDQLEAVFIGLLDGSSSQDNTEAALFDMIHGSEETMDVLGLFYQAAMLNAARAERTDEIPNLIFPRDSPRGCWRFLPE